MRKFFNLLGLIAIVALIGFLIMACAVLEEEVAGNVIYIKNSTGDSISMGNIKPSTEAGSWGDQVKWFYDDYEWYSLPNGETGKITLSKPFSECNVYDIKLSQYSMSNGNVYIKYGVTVTKKGMTINFTKGDMYTESMRSMAEQKVTIQNRTGRTFNSIYIKPTASSDWGSKFERTTYVWFDGLDNNAEDDFTILIPPTNYTVFDIKTESSDNTYIKTNVTISNGNKVLFLSTDRQNPTSEPPVIVIQNNTDETTYEAFIRATSSSAWGNPLLTGYGGLLQGTSYATTVSLSAGISIDVRLSTGGVLPKFYKRTVTLADGLIVTFTSGDAETTP